MIINNTDAITCFTCFDQLHFNPGHFGWYEVEPGEYLCPTCQARALNQRTPLADLKRGVYANGKRDPENVGVVDVAHSAQHTVRANGSIKIVTDNVNSRHLVNVNGLAFSVSDQELRALGAVVGDALAQQDSVSGSLLAFALTPLEPGT